MLSGACCEPPGSESMTCRFTSSTGPCTERCSCTHGTGDRTDGAYWAGITWGWSSKDQSGKRDVAGRPGRHADIRGDHREGAEPPVEEVSLKNIRYRGEAPRGLLSCHARRAQGADLVRFRAAGRPPPPDRHPEGNPQAGLL